MEVKYVNTMYLFRHILNTYIRRKEIDGKEYFLFMSLSQFTEGDF
jgi:hypothetical protein